MVMKVFDFFSGCGGTSRGFQSAGMEIVWAIDNDPYAADTFRLNFPEAHFEESNINELPTSHLESFIEACGENPILFTGCAPCQPYSKQNKQDDPDDARRTLLDQFGRFVQAYKPHYVFVENVPGLQPENPSDDSPFGRFLQTLNENGYRAKHDVIFSQQYGVPQQRERLVLIATRLGDIEFPEKTHGPGRANPNYATVREWIYHFPELEAGKTHSTVANHRAASLSAINIERLSHTPAGGNRRNWPEHLWLECHKTYDGHTDVYGRMHWDRPATCLTTRCTSISNGRFGHPEQNRAISEREAASLQTFPDDFIFTGGIIAVSRQIGNAVPVLLAQKFGENFDLHYQSHMNEAVDGEV